MALITRFEDVHAWQEARKLVKMIYMLPLRVILRRILACGTRFNAPPFP
jgi:hypothetical protein